MYLHYAVRVVRAHWFRMEDEDVQMQTENERKGELYEAKKGMR